MNLNFIAIAVVKMICFVFSRLSLERAVAAFDAAAQISDRGQRKFTNRFEYIHSLELFYFSLLSFTLLLYGMKQVTI